MELRIDLGNALTACAASFRCLGPLLDEPSRVGDFGPIPNPQVLMIKTQITLFWVYRLALAPYVTVGQDFAFLWLAPIVP
jgi:hypothetical protein